MRDDWLPGGVGRNRTPYRVHASHALERFQSVSGTWCETERQKEFAVGTQSHGEHTETTAAKFVYLNKRLSAKFVYLNKRLCSCRFGCHPSSGCPRLGPFSPRGMFTAHTDLHCLQVIDGHVVCTTHSRQRGFEARRSFLERIARFKVA